MVSFKQLILEAIKNYKNIQNIATFKKGVAGDKYKPLTPAEKKAFANAMANTSTSEEMKNKIREKTINSNLRIIPTWYTEMNAENFGFDFDEFVSMAYQALKRAVEHPSFKWGTTDLATYARRAVKNAMTNVGLKRQKEKSKVGQLDNPKYGDEDDKLTVADTIPAAREYEADFDIKSLMDNDEVADRIKEFLQTNNRLQRLIITWYTDPRFDGITPNELRKLFNETYEENVTNQAFSYNMFR